MLGFQHGPHHRRRIRGRTIVRGRERGRRSEDEHLPIRIDDQQVQNKAADPQRQEQHQGVLETEGAVGHREGQGVPGRVHHDPLPQQLLQQQVL